MQGLGRFGWYVWDQGHGMRGDYGGRCNPSHEFIFHFNKTAVDAVKWIDCKHAGKKGGENRGKDGVVPQWSGDFIQLHKVPDSVWRIERQKGGIDGHPAPFSVPLVAHAIQTWNSASIYEPFCGSGTTLIAAHQLNRHAYCMELEPKYCDVAVKRWENFTGLKAVRAAGVV